MLQRTHRAAALIIVLVFAAAAGIAPRTASMSSDTHSVIRLSTEQLRGTFANADMLPRPMLRADALMLTPSPSELEIAQLAQDERCLAEAIYYEARGEGTDERHRAVAARGKIDGKKNVTETHLANKSGNQTSRFP